MPEVSYSALANWDGRLSAPGSVNGDEIPSGSRSSSHPPRTSPRIDPTPNGYSHAHISSIMIAEKGGVAGSPNVVAERTERGAGSASEKDAMPARPSPELPSPLPPSATEPAPGPVPDDMKQQAPLPTQPSPSCPQPRAQKPTSRTTRSGQHSPTRDKRDHSRSRAPPQDDDADSLMDADGETDHESEASVYPIQNVPGSSTATPNTSTRDSTEATIVQTPSVSKRQKPPSKISSANGFPGGTEESHVLRSPASQRAPSAIATRSSTRVATHQASPPPVPSGSGQSPSLKTHSPPLSSPLTSPDMPLCDLPFVRPSSTATSSNPRPMKKRRLNRAYVEVPPLPPWRRRASYQPALALFEHAFEAAEDDAVMGEDYAAGLGLVLNGVAASNEREVSVSTSPARASVSRRPIRSSRLRARESLVREPLSVRAASVTTSVSKKRGRPPAPKKDTKRIESAVPVEEEPAPKRRSGRVPKTEEKEDVASKGRGKGKGKGKGKEKAREVDVEVDNPDGPAEEDRLPLVAEADKAEQAEEEKAEEVFDDDLEDEDEPHLPADNLEIFLPSVRIQIGTYPQAADEVLHMAFRRLLIASKNSVWPPRSEQSVTSSLCQAGSVTINPTTFSSPTRPSAPTTPTELLTSASRPPPPPSASTKANKPSQPVRPLPRRSHLKSAALHRAKGASASSASSPPRTAKEPSSRPSKSSSSAHTPQTPSDVHPVATATSSPQTNLPSTSQSPLKPSQPSVSPPQQVDPTRTLPVPSAHPPCSDGRTDSQQSFDINSLLADFDAHPDTSPVSTSPSQSQPSFSAGLPPGTLPPSPPGGFKTLQQILVHFGPGHTPISPSSGDSRHDVPQNASTPTPHATPPTPGDKFLRSIGYEGTEVQCGSFFPWVLDGHSEEHLDLDLGGASGTIDPSLLAGPPPEARPPSMSPPASSSHSHSQSHTDPVAGPSRLSDVIDLTLEVSSQSSAQSHSPRTPQDVGSDSDSDPGEDVPLSRRLQRQFPPLSKDLPVVEVEGRRHRRLTERALAMRHTLEIRVSDENDGGFLRGPASPSKSKKGAGKDAGKPYQRNGAGKGKGKGKEKEKESAGEVGERSDGKAIRKLAAQPTFCHQCRRATMREKMRCSTIRASGDPCGLRFCDRCIELRYPGMTFDAYARQFVCPRCLDTCNCTACCSRRGETYISARVGKLPPANTAEALALIKAAEENLLRGDAPSRNVVARRMITPPAPKFDLVSGQFFGVIYGLEGERMGPGFMGEDNQRVLVTSQSKAGKAKGAGRGPGRPKRRIRYGKAVAYIGERRPPSRALIPSASVSASTSVPPPASSSVSQDSQEASQAANDQHSLPPAAAPSIPEPERAVIPPPRGRMYIGDRSVLDKGTYVAMDELIARAIREEEEDLAWGGPLSDPPSMDDQDEAAAPARQNVAYSTLDVQYAIAVALHTLQGSPKDQKIAAADAVRS